MKVRQALKILSKLGTLKYAPGTVRAACRAKRRHKHRLAKCANLRPGSKVKVLTDTAYDEEGVPVSVLPGTPGVVIELDGFPQVLCLTGVGVCVVGVPAEHLQI